MDKSVDMGNVVDIVVNKLKSLTNKRFIYFFDSGDDAIFFMMDHKKKSGSKSIIIPDIGGWFSYRKFPKKLGLDIIELKTEDALIDMNCLKNIISKDSSSSFMLINSIGGYFVEEPMQEIEDYCRENKLTLINDISASIGTSNAKFGDFCIGSFGEDKPIELGSGGFIGSNIELEIPECKFFDDDNNENMRRLDNAIDILDEKLHLWQDIRKMIIEDLSKQDIIHKVIHKEYFGINVVVAFDNDIEKENLINYCDNHMLEYKLCPNYIKVDRDAVSIEIKRIQYKKEI